MGQSIGEGKRGACMRESTGILSFDSAVDTSSPFQRSLRQEGVVKGI
jgi:hypothetical protein